MSNSEMPRLRVPALRLDARKWLKWLSCGLTFGLVVGLVLRLFFQLYAIPTESMSPTLNAGDVVITDRWVQTDRPGHLRGAVVVFTAPVNQQVRFVKRIVGVPGDILAMRDGELWRNGAHVSEPYATRTDKKPTALPMMAWQHAYTLTNAPGSIGSPPLTPSDADWGPLVVPFDKYFVLGDNRSESSDSRYWGFVDSNLLSGRLRLVLSVEEGRWLPSLRRADASRR